MTTPPIALPYTPSANLLKTSTQTELPINKPPSSTLVDLLKQRRSPPASRQISSANNTLSTIAKQPRKSTKRSLAQAKQLAINNDAPLIQVNQRFLFANKKANEHQLYFYQNISTPTNKSILNSSNRRSRSQTITSRSTSEEMPLSLSQPQYLLTTAPINDKHNGSSSNEMVFLNPDGVKHLIHNHQKKKKRSFCLHLVIRIFTIIDIE